MLITRINSMFQNIASSFHLELCHPLIVDIWDRNFINDSEWFESEQLIDVLDALVRVPIIVFYLEFIVSIHGWVMDPRINISVPLCMAVIRVLLTVLNSQLIASWVIQGPEKLRSETLWLTPSVESFPSTYGKSFHLDAYQKNFQAWYLSSEHLLFFKSSIVVMGYHNFIMLSESIFDWLHVKFVLRQPDFFRHFLAFCSESLEACHVLIPNFFYLFIWWKTATVTVDMVPASCCKVITEPGLAWSWKTADPNGFFTVWVGIHYKKELYK